MKIDLPPDVLKGLPAPASDDGLVRVSVGLKVGADGSCDLVEVNDTPVPTGADSEDESAPADDAEPAPPDTTADDQQSSDYTASASQQLGQM